MNASLISLEISVIGLGLVLMLADFFVPAERRRYIGYAAIAALGVLLIASLSGNGSCQFGTAFNGMFVNDALSLFFKRFFIVAAILVLFMAAEFSDRLAAGSIAEYYSLIVFALAGMLFAASSNDFTMLFVSIELITITFYVLVSFQRGKLQSLEAGVKYLILGALSSAFMVFGIALIWGTTGKLNFTELAAVAPQFADSKIFLLGVLFVLVGLGFKIAMFPFQIWAPDVYQGAPTPTTAFLAVTAELGLAAEVVETDFAPESGARATRKLLSKPEPPSAIVYDSDLLAVTGLGVAHQMGFSVPEDLSIIAWDDSLMCGVVHPPLTAVTRDIPAYGAAATRLLLAAIEGPSPEDVETRRAELMPRGSTGPAPMTPSAASQRVGAD